MKNPFVLLSLASSALISTASAATLAANFEGGTTLPLADWKGNGAVSITSDAELTNTTNVLNASSGGQNYLVDSGAGFDASQAITGSFDFHIVEGGNYSNGAFFFGNVQDNLDGGNGDYFRVDLREQSFGARANIVDGDDTTKIVDGSGNNNFQIATGTWYSASFTWSGATGNFSFSWGGTEGPMAFTGYNLNSDEVHFGFGTTDDNALFDNISITGTEFSVIPEPSSVMLLGLGGLALLTRRRR